jgi:hypothetical protein
MKGWGLDFGSSNSTAIETKEGGYSKSTAISLFRNGRIGHIAPGETFTALADASTRVNGLPLNGVVASNGEAFVYIDTARVVKFGVADDVVDAHQQVALAGGHSAHTTLSGTDCDVLAYKNATAEYILYSWNDNTDGDVGRMLTDASSPDDDFLSTVGAQSNGSALTKGVPHKMCIGPDGVIYILNGQHIASLQPNTSAVNYQALDLGFGWVGTDLDIDGVYLIVSAYKAVISITGFTYSDARVFYWDTIKTSYNLVYDLEDNYVSALQVSRGRVYAFTRGRNNTTKIKIRNGSVFETLFESVQIGETPRAGGTDVFQNMIHYATANGERLLAIDGDAFHYRTIPTTDGATSPTDLGMVKNLSQNTLYIGRKVSSSYTIVKINYSGYYSNADFRTRLYETPYKANIDKIIVYPSLIASGGSIQLSFVKNYKNLSIGGADDELGGVSLTFATYGDASSIPVIMPRKITGVDAFYMNIRLNSAAVRKVEIYISPTSKS